jgi:hypothetical protein
MKLFTICAAVLSSLSLLAWPFLFFFSIFLFDAPTKGLAALETLFVACLLWTYPFGYILALERGMQSKRKGMPWWTSPAGYLFLLPLAQLLLVWLAASVVLG